MPISANSMHSNQFFQLPCKNRSGCGGNHLSGLLLIKRMPDSSLHGIFQMKWGSNFLILNSVQMEISGVYSIIKRWTKGPYWKHWRKISNWYWWKTLTAVRLPWEMMVDCSIIFSRNQKDIITTLQTARAANCCGWKGLLPIKPLWKQLWNNMSMVFLIPLVFHTKLWIQYRVKRIERNVTEWFFTINGLQVSGTDVTANHHHYWSSS